MTAADHTPSTATDGLREAVEALRDECSTALAGSAARGWNSEWDRGYNAAVRFIRHRLNRIAAHPAPPSETAPVLDGPSFGDYWPPSETDVEETQP